MILRSQKEAKNKAQFLKEKLKTAKRISLDEKQEILLDIQDLEKFSNSGIVPENPYNNVRLWLFRNSLSTLE